MSLKSRESFINEELDRPLLINLKVIRMTLQLTGKDEPNRLYQEFLSYPTKQMPRLITAGYEPISVAGAGSVNI